MYTRKLKVGEVGPMNELAIGQKAIVKRLNVENPIFRRRLLDMGITKGVTVEIKKVSPMGDPVDIKVRGYELCLRLNDLKSIEIEVIA